MDHMYLEMYIHKAPLRAAPHPSPGPSAGGPMAHHGMACHAVPCRVRACQARPGHIMPYHVTLCHAMPCHGILVVPLTAMNGLQKTNKPSIQIHLIFYFLSYFCMHTVMLIR